MRYFTLAQAEALIPDLEAAFGKALRLRDQAEARAASVRKLEQDGTDPARAAIERAQLQYLVNRVNECLAEVSTLGAVPKGLEPALADFPHKMGDADVYLCWRAGEKKITHYHGVEEGFSGRKPLPKGKKS